MIDNYLTPRWKYFRCIHGDIKFFSKKKLVCIGL